jgi:hypothetical protein
LTAPVSGQVPRKGNNKRDLTSFGHLVGTKASVIPSPLRGEG